MDLFQNRIWLREARRRALHASGFGYFRAWMKGVVTLESLRSEQDLEPLDVLLSFGRYARALALLRRAGPEVPFEERIVREAACLCLLGQGAEARDTLGRLPRPWGLAASWLARLRGWEAFGSEDFAWLLSARFAVRWPPVSDARLEAWRRANVLCEWDDATPSAEWQTRYFPHAPDVALWAALQEVREGRAEWARVVPALERATRAWPELWSVLVVDPWFQPFVTPPRPLPPALPAPLLETLGPWQLLSVTPVRDDGGVSIPLGTHCPEPADFEGHGLFTLEDGQGPLDTLDARARVPPCQLLLGRHADRFDGRYDEDVLGPLRALAPRAEPSWFFIHDLPHDFADELVLGQGRYGFRRWSLDGDDLSALLRRLGRRSEPRFQAPEFQARLRGLD
ncbi:hypothetical protein DRW03_13110 [Corallococcus sp. H22C18031201]|nr:hypothetical protein DRW03_13110 [Corallococcus sp. H22C18031201]